MSKLLSFIKKSLNTHPIITNSLIYGTLYVGAEFSQQTVTKKVLPKRPEPIDYSHIGRYIIYGTALGGPFLSIWYRWLDKMFVGTATKTLTKKLLLDQFVFTPQLLILFYVSMSIMEKKSDWFEECRQKFVPTFKTSCLFWLPAQTVNFLWIPSLFRVAYVSTCSFAWVNILCWIKRQEY